MSTVDFGNGRTCYGCANTWKGMDCMFCIDEYTVRTGIALLYAALVCVLIIGCFTAFVYSLFQCVNGLSWYMAHKCCGKKRKARSQADGDVRIYKYVVAPANSTTPRRRRELVAS